MIWYVVGIGTPLALSPVQIASTHPTYSMVVSKSCVGGGDFLV